MTHYVSNFSAKSCKYFDEGRGECQFRDKCFYLHALPDGTQVTMLPEKRRRRQNADGELAILQRSLLWDFLEEHDNMHRDYDGDDDDLLEGEWASLFDYLTMSRHSLHDWSGDDDMV